MQKSFMILIRQKKEECYDGGKQEKIQSRSKNKENEPKEMDIMRIVHMIIGIIVGIIIGYLIWGVR